MSTPIQKIDSIGPVGGLDAGEEEKSQAQLDYEEGRGYLERGESALAAVSLHNALRGFEEENNRDGIANASNQLGHACISRQEYDKALAHYRRVWEICESIDDQMSLLSVARNLVETHLGLKDYSRAQELCWYLLDSYQQNNNPQGSVDTLELMAKVCIAASQPEKAADAYRTAASIHANFKHHAIAEQLRKKAADLIAEIE